MSTTDWFDDMPVVGKMSKGAIATKLREMGDEESATAIEAELSEEQDTETSEARMMTAPSAPGVAAPRGMLPTPRARLFGPRPWQYTAHAFGYLAPAEPGDDPLPIRHAGNIEADVSLKNSRIKITLDRLRVADYPGGSRHHVLFDFYAQNQVADDIEHLHFNATYIVQEAQQAGIVGHPIFVGLNVGGEGVSFRCFTVNVKNDADETFLSFLEGDAFAGGLQLAVTAQPVVGTFSQMALGLTKAIAARNRNVPVQDIFLGLDFSNIATRARLAEGSYIAVQIPDENVALWNWKEWVYNPNSGQIVHRDDHAQMIPFNYIVFSVTRYEEG
jgi:hypothetical protein